MNELPIEDQLENLDRELRLAVADSDQRLLDLRAEVDRLKLEVAALKNFLGQAIPAFTEQYPRILEQTIAEIDPEAD